MAARLRPARGSAPAPPLPRVQRYQRGRPGVLDNGIVHVPTPVTFEDGASATLPAGTYVEVVGRDGTPPILHVLVYSTFRGKRCDIPEANFRRQPQLANQVIGNAAVGQESGVPHPAEAYRPRRGRLWQPGGPVEADTDQGSLGDCGFIAAMGAIAARNPHQIRSLFADHRPDQMSYGVTIFQRQGNEASQPLRPVRREVDTHFPESVRQQGSPQTTGGAALAYAGRDTRPTALVLWPLLLEKRMAMSWGGYDDLRAMPERSALESLTGRDATHTGEAIASGPASGSAGGFGSLTPAQLLAELRRQLNHGAVVLMTTRRPQHLRQPLSEGSSVLQDMTATRYLGLTPNHVYAVTGVDPRTNSISLRDPHGPGEQLPGPLTADEILEFFRSMTSSAPSTTWSQRSGPQ